MLVVLVAQARVHGQVVPDAPIVLRVQVQPVGPSVLVSSPDARCRRGGIAEEKIGKRVAGKLSGVGERATGVVGLLGPELQMKVVGAELDPVAALVDVKLS